jgi:Zn ribbon nucleic-acid-binding protein
MNYVTNISGEDGFCPKCNSSDTLWISTRVKRACLSCGFSEEFENFSRGLLGWRIKLKLRSDIVADRDNRVDASDKPRETKTVANNRKGIEKIIDVLEPSLTRITVPTRYRDDFRQFLLARKVEQAGPCKTERWNNIESAYSTFELLVRRSVAEAIFEEWGSESNSF